MPEIDTDQNVFPMTMTVSETTTKTIKVDPGSILQYIKSIEDRHNAEIDFLKNEIESIKETYQPKVLYVKEVDYSTAKKMIINYLKTNKIARISEVAEKLHISVEVVFSVFNELKEEGLIE